MQINKSNKQAGFTIIELMVSMSAFTAMILVTTLAIIQISNMYYKGVNTINTQEVTRNTMAVVSEAVQFGSGDISEVKSRDFQVDPNIPISPTDPTTKYTVNAICIGSTRFSYIINFQLVLSLDDVIQDNAIAHVLWQDNGGDENCEPQDLGSNQPTPQGKELLGEKMRLAQFNITPALGNSDLTNVNIGVIYGDADLITFVNGVPTGCNGGVVGSQWCASSFLNTQLNRRIVGSE